MIYKSSQSRLPRRGTWWLPTSWVHNVGYMEGILEDLENNYACGKNEWKIYNHQQPTLYHNTEEWQATHEYCHIVWDQLFYVRIQRQWGLADVVFYNSYVTVLISGAVTLSLTSFPSSTLISAASTDVASSYRNYSTTPIVSVYVHRKADPRLYGNIHVLPVILPCCDKVLVAGDYIFSTHFCHMRSYFPGPPISPPYIQRYEPMR